MVSILCVLYAQRKLMMNAVAEAIESACLNQRVRMGYINKVKEGRRVYFSIEMKQSNVGSLIGPKVAPEAVVSAP